MAAGLPIALNTKSISRFLDHIHDVSLPTKVDTNYLKSVGFKSGNDTALIGIFKTLGFLSGSAAPTDVWTAYRNKDKSKQVLGEAIRSAYSGLFGVYPDAYRKDDEAIANWIRSNSQLSAISVTRAVNTFKVLVANASFEGETVPVSTTSEATSTVGAQAASLPVVAVSKSPSVNINIELQLPSTTDPKVYENFFAAMKKNLLDE